MHDVLIIGAGIAGSACAHFLARYELDVLVIDAEYDIAVGTTRANSGIVHSGYDPEPGTLKAKYNIEGAHMYPELAKQLGFEFRCNGSLIVAFSEEERPAIEKLLARGIENGVEGLRIMESEELHVKEPNLNPEAVAALWAPTGGIVNPYDACLAFAETAARNGVEFRFGVKAEDLMLQDGIWNVTVSYNGDAACAPGNAAESAESAPEGASDVLQARIVINAAGLDSGRLNGCASKAEDLKITPRVGEYLLLDQAHGKAFDSTIFQVPTANGKGVLVSPTVEGNLIIGPNAVVRESPEDTYTTSEGLAQILREASKTWTNIPSWDAITNFAGLRPTCVESPDFHLGEPEDAPGFFNICGFDSPGLTAAPAVGKDFAERIAAKLNATEKAEYIDHREAPRHISKMTDEQLAAAIAEDPAWGTVVCRCERVSEAEIIEALTSPVPAKTADAIKWRTRAGMGRCQSGFCLPITMQLIAREHGIDLADVNKGRDGSFLTFGHRGCFDRLPEVEMGGAQ